MRIQKKRVRNLQINLPEIENGQELLIVVPIAEIKGSRLQHLGFPEKIEVGAKILPSIVGPVSRFNAEGSFIRHRDQPKETCYRQRQWHYKEWHGDQQVEATKIVDVPYERYPRTRISPPSIELQVVVLPTGDLAIAAIGALIFDMADPNRLRHVINLFLELFGFCDVVDKNLLPVGVVPTISLNWQILPEGEMPWSRLKPQIDKVLDLQKKSVRPVVAHRLEVINKYGPTFTAVGHGGFAGYVVFGFPQLGFYILECSRYGNATYVFDNNWKEFSKLTKAEILNQNYYKARFIHLSHWEMHISLLFRSAKAA
jgi:hypothetical protein